MKINVIKKHILPLGDNEVSEARGKYLIRMRVAAEDVKPKEVPDLQPHSAPKKKAAKPTKKDK